MREIQLTQGQVALVDDDMFERLNQFKWFAIRRATGYHATRQVQTPRGKRNLYMHHAIIGLPPKGCDTDHVDRNGLNNMRGNLRFVTRRQNMQNLNKSRTTSRHPGVYWYKSRHKWAAGYYVGVRRIHLGLFESEEAAAATYRAAIHARGERMLGEVACE